MKNNLFKNKNVFTKVAKAKSNSLENGIVVLIAVLLLTNFVLSMRVLFG